jgi:transforming growth factor-beta-induced protein
VILVSVLAFVATACGSDSKSSSTTAKVPADTTAASTTSTSLPPPTKSILELGKEAGTVSTMLGLLDTAGMTTTLEGTGPFTLIAPTDAAFKKMDPATLDKISKSPEVLKQLLQYHLIDGRVTSKDLAAGFVASEEGSQVTLGATSSLPTVNGLIVDRAGRATNGTILIVDSVLIPVDIKLP